MGTRRRAQHPQAAGRPHGAAGDAGLGGGLAPAPVAAALCDLGAGDAARRRQGLLVRPAAGHRSGAAAPVADGAEPAAARRPLRTAAAALLRLIRARPVPSWRFKENRPMTVLTTARLRLEPCEDRHLAGLHAMNSDPAVMRYIT